MVNAILISFSLPNNLWGEVLYYAYCILPRKNLDKMLYEFRKNKILGFLYIIYMVETLKQNYLGVFRISLEKFRVVWRFITLRCDYYFFE